MAASRLCQPTASARRTPRAPPNHEHCPVAAEDREDGGHNVVLDCLLFDCFDADVHPARRGGFDAGGGRSTGRCTATADRCHCAYEFAAVSPDAWAGSGVNDAISAEFLAYNCDPSLTAIGSDAADRRSRRSLVAGLRALADDEPPCLRRGPTRDTSASSIDGDIRHAYADSGVRPRHGRDLERPRRVNLDWALTPTPKHSLRSDSSTNQFRPLIVGVICGTVTTAVLADVRFKLRRYPFHRPPPHRRRLNP